MTYILKRKIIYNTRKSFKFIVLLFLLLISVITLLAFKFKPAYSVTIDGQSVGFTTDKVEIENKIKEEIMSENGNVAFVTINQSPDYKLELVNRTEDMNEEELINSLKENAEVTYKYYAVTFNGETKSYVNTLEEAEKLVAEIKEEHSGNLDLDIGIREYYTADVDDAKQISENDDVTVAKQQLESSVDEYIDKKSKTINDIYLAVTPVNGVITSRFAAIENVRYGAHTGLDIGAASGTPIHATADGVVTYASSMGTYGNLVRISHGNGVETYYAHCSRILVGVGQTVSAGDTIALVGSTGNSTGPHLHLEIRLNGTPINPQKYLYK